LTPQRSPSPALVEPILPAPSRAILPSDKPPAVRAEKKSSYYTIGARIQALTLWENSMPISEVTAKTDVSKSYLYRIRTKACSRGWQPHKVLETWHVDDAPHKGRCNTYST
jgi:hypothetical protein